MRHRAGATREIVLEAAYGLLYREGFARVSMDAIAEAAGVTKRTLYYHFASKDDLVAAVLDHQHLRALAQIQDWITGRPESPEAFVTILFEKFAQWAARPRWLGSGFTRLTMELADRPGHPARRSAHQHKAAVEDWLTAELRARGLRHPRDRARQIVLLLEGCHSLILIHGDPSYARQAAAAARQLLADENQ